MQRPIHTARHAQPAAIAAFAGPGPSCAVEPRAPRGGFAPAGWGTDAGWMKIGLGTPEKIGGHVSDQVGQDRRYSERGRIVARP
jgi:hypothetical protein